MKRKVFVLLIAVLLITALFPLEALAVTKETVVSQSTMHVTKAISTFSAYTRTHSNPVQTIVHFYGTSDYRSLEGSYYFDAQRSLGSPMYATAFASHNTSDLDLVAGKQIWADKSVGVTIPASNPSGTYWIKARWSAMKWNQKVVTTYQGGSTTDQNRTILYAPCKTSKVTSGTYGM